METTAHFDHIPQEIAKRLTAATKQILVAVDPFTDRELFDILCGKARPGEAAVLALALVAKDVIVILDDALALRQAQALGLRLI